MEPAQVRLTQAGQRVDAIDVHSAAPADALPAAAAKGQGRIDLVLDPDQRVEHHRPRLVEVERVRLHAGLRGRLVGAPAVDVEGLDSGRAGRTGLGRRWSRLHERGKGVIAGAHRCKGATQQCGRRQQTRHGQQAG